MSHVPDMCARRAELTPDATAFTDLMSGESVAYAELERRASRAAGFLKTCKVSAGDRVAILCRNRVEFFELLFACGKLGALLVPLNWRMPGAELQPLVDHAAPRVLLYGNEDAATVNGIAHGDTTVIALDTPDGYGNLRDASNMESGRSGWPESDCWYLLYTSGTTGAPKAVIQTYGMAIANYVNIRQAMGISRHDTTLNFLPVFHTAGINLVCLPTLLEGGRVLLLPQFDVDRVVELLAERRLTTFFAVPAVYQQISLHPEFESLELSNVRSFGCGGAAMPDGLLRLFMERGARICNGMGMTETGPTVFIMSPDKVADKVGSVGKPQVLTSVRIVDESGRDVPEGDSGELWFSGANVTPGYWHADDETAAAFSEDGWLKSGDIGRRDADGYYYIVGRIKDMFVSGGENVYPAEVETVLSRHEDILEAAVIAVPDDKWGEVGRAYMLPRPDHRIPVPDELISYCRKHLAAYKVPRSFVAVSDFPRTAAGKIQKHLLKAM